MRLTRDYQVVERVLNNPASEISLVERAQGGSVEAFEQIVRTHQRLIRSFAVRHVGCQQVADDIAQEVFVAAFRGIDRFQGTGTVTSWLLGITRNRGLTYLRSKPVSKTVSLDRVLEEVHIGSLDTDPFDVDAEERRIDALRSCIQALDARHRDALVRFYYKSESAEQIARSIGKRAGAVRMLLLRVRKLLRNCIDGKLRDGGAG